MELGEVHLLRALGRLEQRAGSAEDVRGVGVKLVSLRAVVHNVNLALLGVRARGGGEGGGDEECENGFEHVCSIEMNF